MFRFAQTSRKKSRRTISCHKPSHLTIVCAKSCTNFFARALFVNQLCLSNCFRRCRDTPSRVRDSRIKNYFLLPYKIFQENRSRNRYSNRGISSLGTPTDQKPTHASFEDSFSSNLFGDFWSACSCVSRSPSKTLLIKYKTHPFGRK